MSALKNTSKAHQASPQRGWRFPAQSWPKLPRQAVLPLAFVAGIASYLTAPTEPSWALLGLSVAVFAGLLFAARRSAPLLLRLSLTVALLIAAGGLVAKLQAHLVAAPVLKQELGPVRIEGRLAKIDTNDNGRRLTLEVEAIEGLPRAQTPAYVRFGYADRQPFEPGRALSCLVILMPPPEPTLAGDYAFSRQAWYEKLGAVGFALNECRPIYQPNPKSFIEVFTYRVAAIRTAIASHVYNLTNDSGGAFAAAVITGDRSYLAIEDVEALRDSGLAHLLAISGLHMALAGGAFFMGIRLVWPMLGLAALKFPAVKVAALGAIIGCTIYFFLSGGSVATQRAYTMALIALGAKLMDKPALSLRSLAIAMVAISILHPSAVTTPGFQMSFAASAALIGTFEALPRRSRGGPSTSTTRVRNWAGGVLLTSIAASLSTMPFALYHFDRAATLSILANLMVTPIVSFWAAPTAAATLLTWPLGLQDMFIVLLAGSLEQILAIAHWITAHSPSVEFNRVSGLHLALAVLTIASFSAGRGWARMLSVIPLTTGAALWLSNPRPIAHVAADGSFYWRTAAGWVADRRWRTRDALPPLALDDTITESKCTDRLLPCRITTIAGEVEISEPKASSHANSSTPLSSQSDTCVYGNRTVGISFVEAGRHISIDACDLSPEVNIEIHNSTQGLSATYRRMQTNRPWSR